MSSPCSSTSRSSWPLRKTPRMWPSSRFQSRWVMRRPSGRNHQASGSPSPRGPAPAQEVRAPERRVVVAQRISRRVKSSRPRRASAQVPVEPGDLGVLAPGVVVAVLGAAELVAAEQHRRALTTAAAWPGSCAAGARAAALISGVVGRPLDAAVPGAVVVGAVAVVLEVGLVVLVVVGDEVAQREAVVGGDEVDRGERVAAVLLVEVAGAGQARGELADVGLAAPEVAHRVAVDAVPLRSTAPGSCRPGSRPGRRPTARRSA